MVDGRGSRAAAVFFSQKLAGLISLAENRLDLRIVARVELTIIAIVVQSPQICIRPFLYCVAQPLIDRVGSQENSEDIGSYIQYLHKFMMV
jgi:hypothetical protein